MTKQRHATVKIPSAETPLFDVETGRMNPAWYGFFAFMGGNAPTFEPVVLSASPFQYAASVVGTLVVTGGTVSLKQLTRKRDTITVADTMISVSLGDIVTVTYTVAPTITFVPLGPPM